MKNEKQTGRLIGGLLLLTMLLGLWNNFGLTQPIFDEPGWLHNGAQMPSLFAASALLAVVTSLLMLAVGVLAWPVLRQTSPSLALAFVLLSAVVVATNAVEQSNFLAMRSLSLQLAKHPGLDPAVLEIMRNMVGAGRHGIHYLDKLIAGLAMFVLFLALFHSKLVPRILPVLGLLATPIQTLALSSVLFLQPMNTALLAPLALSLFALSLTLLVRGFAKSAAPHAAPSPTV